MYSEIPGKGIGYRGHPHSTDDSRSDERRWSLSNKLVLPGGNTGDYAIGANKWDDLMEERRWPWLRSGNVGNGSLNETVARFVPSYSYIPFHLLFLLQYIRRKCRGLRSYGSSGFRLADNLRTRFPLLLVGNNRI